MSGTREAYRLREKRVYCHVGDRVSFWEGVSLAWAHKWDLRQVREVIIGGDGAAWIRSGVETFCGATWQLDGFHLARACRQAFGSLTGRELYQALRTGAAAKMQASLSQTPLREGKQAQRASRWVEKVAQKKWGLDWRVRQGSTLEDARGLGCMEGNQAQLLAARMKSKGRSWSPKGAYHMAKVQELLTNHESATLVLPANALRKNTRTLHPPSPLTANRLRSVDASCCPGSLRSVSKHPLGALPASVDPP